MSIFTQTFQDFVFNQLKIREAAINQKSGRSLGAPKVKGLRGTDSSKTNITLPAGAFFTTTTSKQCTIRMSSGVDLKSENDLLDENDIGKKNLVNEGLAIRYMLEGGVPAKDVDFLNNRKEGQSEVKVIPRGRGTRQFTGGSGKDYGSAYGDPYIRSNAGDDFGIVPMPGIIDAQIRTKTAYGSLRDAQINFVCHNRRQLDILETLYMRPGMPILLEWGWSTYINNEGKRDNYFPYLWEWFNKNETLNNINKLIHKRIELAGGNYDGFVGYVKNFEIISRPDGGYDCSVDLAAMGEVVEGIKGKSEGLILRDKDGETDIEVDNLEFYLEALFQFCENRSSIQLHKELKTGAKASFTKDLSLFLSKIQTNVIPLVKSSYKSSVDFGDERFSNEDSKNTIIDEDNAGLFIGSKAKNANRDLLDEFDQMETILDRYLLYKGEKLGVNANELDNTESSIHYIRWDLMCDIINNLVINNYQTKKKSEPIIRLSYKKELPVRGPKEYLQYSKFNFLQKFVDIVRPSNNEVVTVNIPDLLDMSIDPEKCLLPHQIKGLIADSDSSVKNGFKPDESEAPDRNIGHVFIGLEYLIKLYKKLRYKGDEVIEDFNLLTFLQTIWEKDINNACGGTHNFVISTEKTSGDVIRIIDLTKGPEQNLTPSNLYKFKTHGNNSIVRDFNYNTTIDSKLSSTVAIAAQSPNDLSSLDAVSFAAFNRNIQSRFFKELNEGDSESVKGKKADKYDKDMESAKNSLGYLYDYRINMLLGKHEKDQGTALSYVKSLESKITSLKSRYSKTLKERKIYKGYPRRKTNISKSTIIPLKFNCQIDGIGGLIIGNVFKVDKTFLPKGYEQDDVAFAVTTENQSITPGQDWTTEFSGQVILLDLPGKGAHEDLIIDNSLSSRPTKINSHINRDSRGGNISPEQQKIDENLYNTENNAIIYLKLDNEDTNIRTGAETDNRSISKLDFDDNIAGVIPKGNRESINVEGLGRKISEKIQQGDQIFPLTTGDSLPISDEAKKQIGYKEITYENENYILINKDNMDAPNNQSAAKRYKNTPTYPKDDSKYMFPLGKSVQVKVPLPITWYEIEFNETALGIITDKNQMNNNTGFMRVDVLQSSPDFDPTK